MHKQSTVGEQRRRAAASIKENVDGQLPQVASFYQIQQGFQEIFFPYLLLICLLPFKMRQYSNCIDFIFGRLILLVSMFSSCRRLCVCAIRVHVKESLFPIVSWSSWA